MRGQSVIFSQPYEVDCVKSEQDLPALIPAAQHGKSRKRLISVTSHISVLEFTLEVRRYLCNVATPYIAYIGAVLRFVPRKLRLWGRASSK